MNVKQNLHAKLIARSFVKVEVLEIVFDIFLIVEVATLLEGFDFLRVGSVCFEYALHFFQVC